MVLNMKHDTFPKDVSIMIISWKDTEHLEEWFDCFLRYCDLRTISMEVLVCDNDSQNPRYDEIAEKYSTLGDFYFSKNFRNEGLAAFNPLFSATRGKYVMMCAPGAAFSGDCVKYLKEYLDTNPSAGAATSIFLDANMRPEPAYGRPCDSLLRIFFLAGDALLLYRIRMLFGKLIHKFASSFTKRNFMSSEISKGPFMISSTHVCSVMLRREALAGATYLIDPNIPLGPCDADLFDRVRKNGYTVFGVPQARVVHHKSVSVRKLDDHHRYFVRSVSLLGSLVYFRNHHPFQFFIFKYYALLDRLVQVLLACIGIRKGSYKINLIYHFTMLKLLFGFVMPKSRQVNYVHALEDALHKVKK